MLLPTQSNTFPVVEEPGPRLLPGRLRVAQQRGVQRVGGHHGRGVDRPRTGRHALKPGGGGGGGGAVVRGEAGARGADAGQHLLQRLGPAASRALLEDLDQ